mmetsp:Transcript_19446/g.47506  ORF Transcript_19446/g.47506 Transcript_19446/m.47506 type:complete len:106 (+) Transcript_19446:408-725(+)
MFARGEACAYVLRDQKQNNKVQWDETIKTSKTEFGRSIWRAVGGVYIMSAVLPAVRQKNIVWGNLRSLLTLHFVGSSLMNAPTSKCMFLNASTSTRQNEMQRCVI